MHELNAAGITAVGLNGFDGTLLESTLFRQRNVRLCRRSNRTLIQHLLDTLTAAGIVPVIACIGATKEGQALNINGDTVASEIALAVEADSLLLVTDVAGIRINDEYQKEVTRSLIEQWIEEGHIYGGMIPKVQGALNCLQAGIPSVQIVNDTLTGTTILNEELVKMSALFQNYARRPIAIVEGKGTEVFDTTGKRYLDFTSGIAVCSLGHAHPAIVKAIQEQSEKLWHISNLFESPGQEKLAETLVKDIHLSHAFFCNSGAEANEAAIKIARKHTGKHHIIVFEQSFHGRTFGAMSATGQDKVRNGFGPLVSEFTTLPFNDVEALKAAVDDSVAAIMLEIIQGEGGVNAVTDEFAASNSRHSCKIVIFY